MATRKVVQQSRESIAMMGPWRALVFALFLGRSLEPYTQNRLNPRPSCLLSLLNKTAQDVEGAENT